jgi:hypothetical protein
MIRAVGFRASTLRLIGLLVALMLANLSYRGEEGIRVSEAFPGGDF